MYRSIADKGGQFSLSRPEWDMNALNMRREEATKTAKQKKHVQKQNRAQHGAVLCGLLLQQGRFSAPPAE